MNIVRRASVWDIPDLLRLLVQVNMVHHNGRPDLFKGPSTKYTERELREILADDETPVFVCVPAGGEPGTRGPVLGYAFCVLKQHVNHSILTDIKTLYIDDLCVDEQLRGQGVGRTLYDYVVQYARSIGCYNLTLNVWSLNPAAMGFYERCGLVPQKVGLETILSAAPAAPAFRELRRKKQALSREECVKILTEEPRGVLSVLGDGGYPYGVPMDFWYDPADGKLYFHGAKSGHKQDAIRRSSKASFTVMDEGYRREGEWALNIRSVIVFGRMDIVRDQDRALEICRRLCEKFTSDEAYIQDELRRSGPRVRCLSLTPDHISGKLVNES